VRGNYALMAGKTPRRHLLGHELRLRRRHAVRRIAGEFEVIIFSFVVPCKATVRPSKADKLSYWEREPLRPQNAVQGKFRGYGGIPGSLLTRRSLIRLRAPTRRLVRFDVVLYPQAPQNAVQGKFRGYKAPYRPGYSRGYPRQQRVEIFSSKFPRRGGYQNPKKYYPAIDDALRVKWDKGWNINVPTP
jgi:hypothetical protein